MPDPTNGVHRLVDMVVEEVSLVDRAANQRRFLIVKRDDSMDTEETKKVDVPEDSPLGMALAALESLTDIVELLGDGDSDPRITALAEQLRTTGEQLLAQVGLAESEDGDETEKTKSMHLARHRLADGSGLGLEALGLGLAATVMGQLGRAPSHEALGARISRDRVRAVLEVIEARAERDLRLGDLARIAGISPFAFLRLFKREVGVTPHRFLIQTRIRRSVALLRDTACPVTEIAAAVGFGDLSNFITTFRREVGCSPARFRRLDGVATRASEGSGAAPRRRRR